MDFFPFTRRKFPLSLNEAISSLISTTCFPVSTISSLFSMTTFFSSSILSSTFLTSTLLLHSSKLASSLSACFPPPSFGINFSILLTYSSNLLILSSFSRSLIFKIFISFFCASIRAACSQKRHTLVDEISAKLPSLKSTTHLLTLHLKHTDFNFSTIFTDFKLYCNTNDHQPYILK